VKRPYTICLGGPKQQRCSQKRHPMQFNGSIAEPVRTRASNKLTTPLALVLAPTSSPSAEVTSLRPWSTMPPRRVKAIIDVNCLEPLLQPLHRCGYAPAVRFAVSQHTLPPDATSGKAEEPLALYGMTYECLCSVERIERLPRTWRWIEANIQGSRLGKSNCSKWSSHHSTSPRVYMRFGSML
jgi:hypothetical protein